MCFFQEKIVFPDDGNTAEASADEVDDDGEDEYVFSYEGGPDDPVVQQSLEDRCKTVAGSACVDINLCSDEGEVRLG